MNYVLRSSIKHDACLVCSPFASSKLRVCARLTLCESSVVNPHSGQAENTVALVPIVRAWVILLIANSTIAPLLSICSSNLDTQLSESNDCGNHRATYFVTSVTKTTMQSQSTDRNCVMDTYDSEATIRDMDRK